MNIIINKNSECCVEWFVQSEKDPGLLVIIFMVVKLSNSFFPQKTLSLGVGHTSKVKEVK